jgi:hypothetical protein
MVHGGNAHYRGHIPQTHTLQERQVEFDHAAEVAQSIRSSIAVGSGIRKGPYPYAVENYKNDPPHDELGFPGPRVGIAVYLLKMGRAHVRVDLCSG